MSDRSKIANLEPQPAPVVSSGRARGKKSKKAAKKLLLLVAAIAGGLWGAHFIYSSFHYEETEDAYVVGHVHMVSPSLNAIVKSVLVEDNQEVKAGQVLVQLEPLEFDIALAKARAKLDQAKAQKLQAQSALKQSQALTAQGRAQTEQAHAQVAQCASQFDLAKTNFERAARLLEVKGMSKSEYDSANSALETAWAALASAKAGLEAAQSRDDANQASAAMAQAQDSICDAAIATQQAEVRDAERQLSYVNLVAPVDGRIGAKNVESGNRVQSGQSLVALVEPNLWLVANFKETQLKRMRAGQPVEFSIDAIEGHEFKGHVESISPATGAQFALLPPDNATGNFTKVVQRVPVKIVIDPESLKGVEDRLRPGLSAVVNVRVK